MHRKPLLPRIACALVAGAALHAGAALAQVVPFSSAKPGAVLPKGWEPLTFGSLKNPTEYRFVEDQGGVVLNAKADNAASGLIFPLKLDVKATPNIQFRWKIAKLIEGADNAVASKEDSPVRITLGFDGDNGKLTFGEKTKSALAKTATGRELPYAQLVYVWANTYPVGTVIPNPHTKRVQMIVAASGPADVGKWVTITRNVVEDFRKAFGENPGLLQDVGILTDTDNTKASVEAWYGDIKFLPGP
ncbi:MAG: DUF3047 domain-containing protein [Burkholderiales bacterium]|nr:DUF3047 domain-containing protein [Burkholderiales bacterium]